jgi:hypothetical protein
MKAARSIPVDGKSALRNRLIAPPTRGRSRFLARQYCARNPGADVNATMKLWDR